MSSSTSSPKVPYEIWAQFRIRQLREEANNIEKALQEYLSIDHSAIDLSEPSHFPTVDIEGASTGKYAPLVAAWQSGGKNGLTHPEIYELAQKTMHDMTSENAVRVFVSSLRNRGFVEERHKKFFLISPVRPHMSA